MLEGVVKNIAHLPSGQHYHVDIDLKENLITSYNIKLPYQLNMEGVAEIITDDLRLISRILYPFRNLF